MPIDTPSYHVESNYCRLYRHLIPRSLARKRAQARGLSAPTGRLGKVGAHGQQQPSQAGVSTVQVNVKLR
eukprot:3471851-Pleurochrysis_carterae.AAC.6